MDSMGSIVLHDTVVMLYKLHTQHRATGWQRQTTMLENTFQFCAQQQQRKRRWWWRRRWRRRRRVWDGEDVSVGGCQRQQLTGKQTEGQTHRLSVWKRKEGSQLKRSRVKEDWGVRPHCVCCSFVWHWQQCVWVIFSQLVCVCAANLLPAKCFVWSFCKIYLACLPPCLVFSRAPVHSSCLATRVLVIVLATSWPKK